MRRIDDEHAEEHADDEGKRQIFGKPAQRIQNVRMHQQIIRHAQQRPDQRKFRADDAFDVAPFMGIIPQAHMVVMQACPTGDVFDRRHAYADQHEQQNFAPDRAGIPESIAQFRKHEHDAKAAAVQRQVRPRAEAGVDPFALRIVGGDEAAEQQLQHPAQHGADEEQKRQRQKCTHAVGSPLCRFLYPRLFCASGDAGYDTRHFIHLIFHIGDQLQLRARAIQIVVFAVDAEVGIALNMIGEEANAAFQRHQL